MNTMLAWLGGRLARYLAREVHIHSMAPPTRPDLLLKVLQPGDVLLVEGNSRVSTAIKYLTQSTWSHAALCMSGNTSPKLEGIRIITLSRPTQSKVYAALAWTFLNICTPASVDPSA